MSKEAPWTKGAHAACFLSCMGDLQQAHTIERLLTLLEQCIPQPITLEPVIGDRTSCLMQQRNLPDGSQLVFITHQEGTESLLTLPLSIEVPQAVKSWYNESGCELPIGMAQEAMHLPCMA